MLEHIYICMSYELHSTNQTTCLTYSLGLKGLYSTDLRSAHRLSLQLYVRKFTDLIVFIDD